MKQQFCTIVAIILLVSVIAVPTRSIFTNNAGKVILTFDDSVQGNWDDASVDIMWTYGYRGVTFFQVDCITKQNVEVWQTLLLRRWEFGSHTVRHLHLESVSMSQLIFEVQQSKKWIEQCFNTRVVSFAYPYSEGSYNATVLQAVRNAGYVYARAGAANPDWQGQPSLQIDCYEFSHFNYLIRVQELIAAANKYGVAVAQFHYVNPSRTGWNALSPSDFTYVLNAIKNAGLDVVTFKDL